MFAISVPLAPAAPAAPAAAPAGPAEAARRRTGAILVIEDDPELSALLETFLAGEGHRVTLALSGPAALDRLAQGALRPDLVVTDFNLPGGLNGLDLADRLRARLGAALPVIVLTGDIAAATLQTVAAQGCVHLSKPVALAQFTRTIQRLLPASCAAAPHDGAADAAAIFVVDDDAAVREAVAALLAQDGRAARAYASSAEFLAAFRPAPGQCLLLDSTLPDLDGLELLRRLRADGHRIPTVMMTGHGDVRLAVAAMQAGAADFIEKPVSGAELLASLQRALDGGQTGDGLAAARRKAQATLATLTSRQREIMTRVLDGQPNKNIAADLGISRRTVENHRAAIMRKADAASLPALVRFALAASGAAGEAGGPIHP
jgi:two-component system CheB/CheR fusion protein